MRLQRVLFDPRDEIDDLFTRARTHSPIFAIELTSQSLAGERYFNFADSPGEKKPDKRRPTQISDVVGEDPIRNNEESMEPVGFPSKMKTRGVSPNGKSFPLFTTGYAGSGNRRGPSARRLARG